MTVPKALADSGLMSTADVADKLDVHRSTVWNWIKSGALRSERHGAFHGVSPKSLRAFLSVYQISKPKKKTNHRKKK